MMGFGIIKDYRDLVADDGFWQKMFKVLVKVHTQPPRLM